MEKLKKNYSKNYRTTIENHKKNVRKTIEKQQKDERRMKESLFRWANLLNVPESLLYSYTLQKNESNIQKNKRKTEEKRKQIERKTIKKTKANL